ncbi:2-dehydropantoate 2-reductase [Salinicola sp. CPA57]|uniref:ketopantoate reductase family protein n=1 Tax=Salinicola sp. CPA57 TaxID=1949080 RepID=UPI000DA1F037|nr:2-dehydropantoate 2-reductase [Salinicola sp. CPA57]
MSRPARSSGDIPPWLIVGAGALGQLFAASLAPHHPVVLLGRRPAAPVVRLRTVDGSDLSVALRRELPSEWAAKREEIDAPALVMLATKSRDTQAALDALSPRLKPTTPLLLLQNGFQIQPRISGRWAGPVLCASTTEAAYRPAPATDHASIDVVHAAAGETWIGDLAGQHHDLASTVAACLNDAGMIAGACRDIRQRLWWKLAVNAVINPLTASHRVLNGELAKPEFRPRIATLVAEISRIMQAEGIQPPGKGWQALVDGVIETTAANQSSMLQDVLAGRPTERDAILGPLIDAGCRHALETSTLTALYQTTPN